MILNTVQQVSEAATMSELQSLKKAELSEICHRLGIHSLSKDTKKVLIEKVSQYITLNGDAGVEAVQAALDAEIHEAESLNAKTESATAADDEDEDEDEEDEEDEDEEDEDASDEEEGEEDKDYESGPPLNLRTWVLDPAIKIYEDAHSKVLELTDKVGITTVDINGELRENLSKAVTLNYLELLVELAYFLYYFVPLVAIKDNSSFHQILKDNVPFFAHSEYVSPDFSALLSYGPLSTFFTWGFLAVLAPLAVSYYVNFTRRLITFEDDTEFFARIYTYDPFTFALSKVLVFYFLGTHFHRDLVVDGGFLGLVQNHVTIQHDFFQKFASLLGSFPLVIGISNVLVAIYSQFEEY